MVQDREDTSEDSAPKTEPPPSGSPEPGAPIPPDAVDPELMRLSVPLPRRHPVIAIAVLLVGALLIYRLRADLSYALKDGQPRDLGSAATALKNGQLAAAIETYATLSGPPDHRNGLAFDPKGGRARMQVFRLLGTGSRVLVAMPASPSPPYADRFTGRLRRFDDVSYAEALRAAWQQTQVLRAVDLGKLRALPPGALPSPLSTSDRAGEPLQIAGQQDLLIDVLFPNDLRVLLSKEKFPSEADARHEVERLGLSHGPGVETKDGYGYVLRLPPPGPERQKVLAQIDAQGMWLWHRIETFRVPATAVQVTPAGLQLPGPDSLPQPVRYIVETTPPDAGAAGAAVPPGAVNPAAPPKLVPQKDPSTQLLWEEVQAVMVSEALHVPEGAVLLVAGDPPSSYVYTLPLAALLLLFMGFNVWYLVRSLKR
jgi:hypothetical protein